MKAAPLERSAFDSIRSFEERAEHTKRLVPTQQRCVMIPPNKGLIVPFIGAKTGDPFWDEVLPEERLRRRLLVDPDDPFAAEDDGLPPVMTAAAFLAAARTPEFLIEPIIQRGFLYSLTARSYHGKTTLMIYLALCVATGRPFAGLPVKQGKVAYLAGENPDEFAQKLETACAFWGDDPVIPPDLHIVPGAFDLSESRDALREKLTPFGPLALIVPDTLAAYRFDDDEDDNQGSKAIAQDMRTLCRLPGNPAVITPCHPTKNADRTSLLPRGGGAFLNEVDANLTLWADLDAATTELHWQGKLRGPSFKPMAFDLRNCPHPTACRSDGRPVELAVAVPGEGSTRPVLPRVRPGVLMFHTALLDAMALPLLADEPPTPGETTMPMWLSECIRRGLVEPPEAGETPIQKGARLVRLRDAKRRLIEAGWIGIDGNRIMNMKR
jgi:hypothetical protein